MSWLTSLSALEPKGAVAPSGSGGSRLFNQQLSTISQKQSVSDRQLNIHFFQVTSISNNTIGTLISGDMNIGEDMQIERINNK